MNSLHTYALLPRCVPALFALSGLLAATISSPVAAQGTSPPASPAAPKLDEPVAQVTAAPGKGIRVATKDGSFAFGVRGRVQMRDTFTHTAKADTNEINIKTVRLVLAGQVLVPELKYLVQLAFGSNDFEKDNASPVFDAYVEYTGWRDLNVRVGQFFVPFDRARTIREFALHLVDRPQVV
ncbi:MAG: porin, partial [Byssovorax sp.]